MDRKQHWEDVYDRKAATQVSWYQVEATLSWRLIEEAAGGRAISIIDVGVEVVLDAVLRALAADAGFLDAAEGRDFGGDDAGVDADDAVFQRLGHAPDAADVAA
jgi:hypothetical protein